MPLTVQRGGARPAPLWVFYLVLAMWPAGCTFDSASLQSVACDESMSCADGSECVDGLCMAITTTPDTSVEGVCGNRVCFVGEEACCDVEGLPTCVRILNHDQHCGACGVICGDNESCLDDQCVCDAGLANCDDQPGCETELGTNAHCLSCDACPAGLTCGLSGCSCPGGQDDCQAGECIDLLDNVAACGDCSVQCAPNETCENGLCQCEGITCGDGKACCATGGSISCVDTSSNRFHCGACGEVCPSGHECVDGICDCNAKGRCPSDVEVCCEGDCQADACTCGGLICGENESCCGSGPTCINLLNDASNCGSCGQACQVVGEVCINGECSCPAGELACDDQCVDVSSNPTACGACTNSCQTGEQCCAGQCISLDSALNCGACGARCEGSTPDCCGGSCVSFANDVESCGACNNACAATVSNAPPTCVAGQCTHGPCVSGYDDCDGVAANGCETDINTPQNCGACGVPCPCTAPQSDCDGSSATVCETNTQTDDAHCGGCGMACATGAACSNGVCKCTSGQKNECYASQGSCATNGTCQ